MVKSVFIALKEAAARESIYEFLSSAGYTKVQCVPNTHQTLKLLEAERPHLLILGEDLPSEGGLKALERIRSFEHETKVVFLTQDEPSGRDRGYGTSLKYICDNKNGFLHAFYV